MIPDCIILERIWPPRRTPDRPLSHIGGWPNLPPDVPWPRIRFADGTAAALDFLAQIDLAALPDVAERGLLPPEGMLYFFALSQSNHPFAELGADAFRVLFLTPAAPVPLREPPADTGWGQADPDYGRTEAAQFRRTDGPRGELHPYCPVIAKRLSIAAAERSAKSPSPSTFAYDPKTLPLRVEDAILEISYARNSWFEGILPFAQFADYLRADAERYRKLAARPNRQGVAGPTPPWAAYLLSDAGFGDFTGRYEHWRSLAGDLTARLAALPRSTVLTPLQRAEVLRTVTDCSALRSSVSKHGFRGWGAANVARLALTELLLVDPDLANRYPDEVAAADPTSATFERAHKMFGPGRRVQNRRPSDAQTVTLLQLESDAFGPRFLWWDAGNLTFWISADDARARRFDRVNAEIEGH